MEGKLIELGFEILQKEPSEIKGTKGNQEYFLHIRKVYHKVK